MCSNGFIKPEAAEVTAEPAPEEPKEYYIQYINMIEYNIIKKQDKDKSSENDE